MRWRKTKTKLSVIDPSKVINSSRYYFRIWKIISWHFIPLTLPFHSPDTTQIFMCAFITLRPNGRTSSNLNDKIDFLIAKCHSFYNLKKNEKRNKQTYKMAFFIWNIFTILTLPCGIPLRFQVDFYLTFATEILSSGWLLFYVVFERVLFVFDYLLAFHLFFILLHLLHVLRDQISEKDNVEVSGIGELSSNAGTKCSSFTSR